VVNAQERSAELPWAVSALAEGTEQLAVRVHDRDPVAVADQDPAGVVDRDALGLEAASRDGALIAPVGRVHIESAGTKWGSRLGDVELATRRDGERNGTCDVARS
jgi:hypothetical protein